MSPKKKYDVQENENSSQVSLFGDSSEVQIRFAFLLDPFSVISI